MAVLCLSENRRDLRERLGRMVVAYTMSGGAVTAEHIGAADAMTVLLKEALKPNLVQTAEGTPAIVHGGPFANIAHGCSSVIGTKTALKLADIVLTEAGFGADLGAEKFFDIKCRQAGLKPDAAVLVVTVKALKYNGGVPRGELDKPNPEALQAGLANMNRHVDNIRKFGVPVMVAINHFTSDTTEEIRIVQEQCARLGVKAELSDVWARGSEGGIELAEMLRTMLRRESSRYAPLYSERLGIREKIETIVREIYRGAGIRLNAKVEAKIQEFERQGFGHLPVCMAKTPSSFSDQPNLLGAPENFVVQVRDVTLSAGAGFIVVLTGNIVTMPGLPKTPAAEQIHLDEQGEVVGLF
ncbi:Formate--tetrahydrofolate ligase [compost metagenome]